MSELGLRKVLSNGEERALNKRTKSQQPQLDGEVSDKSSDTASEGSDDRLTRMSNAIRTVIEVSPHRKVCCNCRWIFSH